MKVFKKIIVGLVLVLSLISVPTALVGCKDNKDDNSTQLQTSATINGIDYKFKEAVATQKIVEGNKTRSSALDKPSEKHGGDDYGWYIDFTTSFTVSFEVYAYNTKDIDWNTSTKFFKVVSNNENITFDCGALQGTTTYIVEDANKENITFNPNTFDSISFTNLKITAKQSRFEYHTMSSSVSDLSWGVLGNEQELYNQFKNNLSNEMKSTTFAFYLGDEKICEFKCDIK